ncbi:hypothetical protein [Pseudomonas sp. RIT-To-2]
MNTSLTPCQHLVHSGLMNGFLRTTSTTTTTTATGGPCGEA